MAHRLDLRKADVLKGLHEIRVDLATSQRAHDMSALLPDEVLIQWIHMCHVGANGDGALVERAGWSIGN